MRSTRESSVTATSTAARASRRSGCASARGGTGAGSTSPPRSRLRWSPLLCWRPGERRALLLRFTRGLLRWQGPRVPDADLNPGGEFVVGGAVVRADPQPAGHLPALHHGDGGRGGGRQLVGPPGIDVDEDAALPAGADRQVPADEEREAAEHLLLGQLGVGPDQVP